MVHTKLQLFTMINTFKDSVYVPRQHEMDKHFNPAKSCFFSHTGTVIDMPERYILPEIVREVNLM